MTLLRAGDWLDFLHRGGTVAHFWCASPAPTSTWFEVNPASRLAAWKEAQAVHPEQYVSINPSTRIPPQNKSGNTDPKRISKQIEYIACINVLHCEYDGKDWCQDGEDFYADPTSYKAMALAHIADLPYRPTLIVDSGGGYHCYWYLRDTVYLTDDNRQSVIDTQHWWVLMNGGDQGVSDIARVYRVIGTKNMKPGWASASSATGGNYPTVAAIEYDPHRLYDYRMLAEVAGEWRQATQAASTYTPSPIYTNGDKASGKVRDLFNSSTDLIALLETHSYRVRYRTGSIARLVRPGGETPSLTVLPADGKRPPIVVAHNTADPLYRDGKGHDAYSVMQALAHNGDWKEAYMAAKKVVGMWEEQPKAKHREPTPVKVAPKVEPPAPKPSYNHTDLGNARRMVDLFGRDMMYVHAWDKWYLWNGVRWVEDTTEEIMRWAKRTVARMYEEAARLDDDERAKLVKWALASESKKRLTDMVALARSEPGIACSEKELNANAMLLNCANGTIDLRTGDLLPHDRAHRITKQIRIAYNPAATCPTWLKFLNDIMLGDSGMVAFLQRAMGYSLTGDVSGQCLFFLYGKGSNGKSTFTETCMGLLDEYAQKAPTEMIMQKHGAPGIPNDLARLPGARMVVVSEMEENRHLAESIVKDLTGGDTITARFMRGEWFEFKPTHKLWMYGNHKPVVTGTDDGIWRRLHLIPFLAKFEGTNKDDQMPARLRAEYEGILAWAVEGCVLWQVQGLAAPDPVVSATKDYRSEMDTLQQFIEERCYVNAAVSIRFNELRSAYESWCASYGHKPLTGRKFGNSLTDRGHEGFNGHSNVAMRRGIALAHVE